MSNIERPPPPPPPSGPGGDEEDLTAAVIAIGVCIALSVVALVVALLVWRTWSKPVAAMLSTQVTATPAAAQSGTQMSTQAEPKKAMSAIGESSTEGEEVSVDTVEVLSPADIAAQQTIESAWATPGPPASAA